MRTRSTDQRWRWVALAAVLANTLHNYISSRADGRLPTIGDVAESYSALFTPADYAFSIWGVIYLGFIAYLIWSIRTHPEPAALHRALAQGLIGYAVFGVAWVELFRREWMTVSLGVILAMFAIGALLFGITRRIHASTGTRRLLAAPFSVFYGWITVASFAQLATWVRANRLFAEPGQEVAFTFGLIVASAVAAVIIALRYRDPWYPAVIAWGLLAVWARQREVEPALAAAALGAAGVAVAAAVPGLRRPEPISRRTRSLQT